MSAINQLVDRVRGNTARTLDVARKRVFGVNNERIDFVIDSFYKLSSRQQGLVLAGIGALFVALVIGTILLYLSRVNALDDNLNTSVKALRDLRSLTQSYTYEEKRYSQLQNMIRSSSRSFRPKPFFEAQAKQFGLVITDLRSDEADLPPDSPLAKDFKQVTVEFRLPEVSVPRLIRFISDIEKSDYFLNFSSLQIRSRFGDRLYFEVSAKVVGYKPGA